MGCASPAKRIQDYVPWLGKAFNPGFRERLGEHGEVGAQGMETVSPASDSPLTEAAALVHFAIRRISGAGRPSHTP